MVFIRTSALWQRQTPVDSENRTLSKIWRNIVRNILETVQDRTLVTVIQKYEVGLSFGTEIADLEWPWMCNDRYFASFHRIR